MDEIRGIEASRIIDMGPLRIMDAWSERTSRTSATYHLTIAVGNSVLEISASRAGNVLRIYKDGKELSANHAVEL